MLSPIQLTPIISILNISPYLLYANPDHRKVNGRDSEIRYAVAPTWLATQYWFEDSHPNKALYNLPTRRGAAEGSCSSNQDYRQHPEGKMHRLINTRSRTRPYFDTEIQNHIKNNGCVCASRSFFFGFIIFLFYFHLLPFLASFFPFFFAPSSVNMLCHYKHVMYVALVK